MRIRAFVLIGAALMPSLTLARPQTENRQEPYGAQGDRGTELRCAPGRYMVGLEGASGAFIDRIRVLCAPIAPDGTIGAIDGNTETVGGPGGAPRRYACDPGFGFVTSISVYLENERKQVRTVSGTCPGRSGGTASEFHLGDAPLVVPNKFPLRGTIPLRGYNCPANMAATGLTVRYGQHVNAIGLICNIVVTTAAAATVPPKPVRPGEIRVTGKPKVGPAPAPVTAASYTGRWKVTSRTGETFELVLNNDEANNVTGTITSSDPKKNGTLVGQLTNLGRRINFTYERPGIGVTGTGFFVYQGDQQDGYKRFIGTVKINGNPSGDTVWGGQRQ